MKISKLISLNCANAENKKILYDSLLRLPFFKNKESSSDITCDELEIAYNKICKKYPVMIGYIMSHGIATSDISHHSFMVKTSDTHEHLTTIFALSLCEGMAKTTMYLYAYVRNKYKDVTK